MKPKETEILKLRPLNVVQFWKNSSLRAHHFACPNVKHKSGLLPTGVAITIDKLLCEENYVSYIKPRVPLREQNTKLAIGTKLAFGNISAELIIEWMETYKFLGVDKVITYYVDKINDAALKVLQYYSSTSILELYHHEPAASDQWAQPHPRYWWLKGLLAGIEGVGREQCCVFHFSVHEQAELIKIDIAPRIYHPPNRQKWNDNQMLIFDSFERMSGYTYFGIIDHDEFLIPSSNRSLKRMLADLYGIYKKAAGFVFLEQYFYLSWGTSGARNDLILGSYITREDSEPKIGTEKNIYMPKYTALGGVHTHYTKAIPGFKMVIVPNHQGFTRHYRQCRTEFRRECLEEFRRVKDTSMAEWSKRIEYNVKEVRKRVFGTKQPE